jgi:hypothetical protein
MHFIETYGHPKYYPKSRFLYDPEHDQYTCPAGRTMKFVRVQKDKFGQPLRLYQVYTLTQNCPVGSFVFAHSSYFTVHVLYEVTHFLTVA